MNKRIGVFVLLFLVLISFVSAADVIDTSGLEGAVGGIGDTAEGIKEFTEIDKWEYLSEEWKGFLLENSFLSSIDGFLQKFNIVFVILFGENYDLSLTLLFAIILLIFFFMFFGKIIETFSTFSSWVSWIIAFIFSVILAHLRFYDFLSEILFKIIFFREGIWGWVVFVIFIFAYFFVLMYIRKIIWIVGRWRKKTQKEKEEWDEKFQRELFRKKMKSMDKAFGEIDEGLLNDAKTYVKIDGKIFEGGIKHNKKK